MRERMYQDARRQLEERDDRTKDMGLGEAHRL
jgi:hypothetical protein